MVATTDGVALLPQIVRFTGAITLPPASYAFLVAAAGAGGCSD
jgi:hypothetical protein